jgi:hypothetical protein
VLLFKHKIKNPYEDPPFLNRIFLISIVFIFIIYINYFYNLTFFCTFWLNFDAFFANIFAKLTNQTNEKLMTIGLNKSRLNFALIRFTFKTQKT